MRSRLRGWASQLRKPAIRRDLRRRPGWIAGAWKASPRYCVYGAAAKLVFRVPELLSEPASEPDSVWNAIARRLPLRAATTECAPAWRQLALSIARNYEELADRDTRMKSQPLVSVIVLNYKRLNELAVCLDSALRQDYGNLEIIVVDNHSEEDVAGLVRSRSSSIRLIELPANLGACGGRNAGIREARGEILITIDNDVSFLSSNEASKVVEAFEEHPEAHVLAFRICDAGTGKLRVREWCHPRDWREFSETEFETSFFGEGASAFRREVFDVAGLYWEPLFIGHEGDELGLANPRPWVPDPLLSPSVRLPLHGAGNTLNRSRPVLFLHPELHLDRVQGLRLPGRRPLPDSEALDDGVLQPACLQAGAVCAGRWEGSVG